MDEHEHGGDVIADSVMGRDISPPAVSDPAARAVHDEMVQDVHDALPAEAQEASSSAFSKLFLEPSDLDPDELDNHAIVRLIRRGFRDIFNSPREAFAYLAKAGVAALDKLGLPVGGNRNFPAAVYVLIGLVGVIVSLFTGDDQDDDRAGAGGEDHVAGDQVPPGYDIDLDQHDPPGSGGS